MATESSAYLQAHADNPVDWQPWSEYALQTAQKADKLIFVSSGYSSCHWCHVMEEEVFSQPDVASLLNANFVCIKVDREEQPELDARLVAIQAQLSAERGWPLNVWFTPELKPFFASAGMSKQDFIVTVQQIVNLARSKPELIAQAGSQVLSAINASVPKSTVSLNTRALLAAAVEQELATQDTVWGGAKGAPKFILPPRWRFLLAEYRFTGNKELGKHLRLTLDQLAGSATRDQIGGGFFRYSVDMQWKQPHFEKLLSINAQLAQLYLEASVAFQEPRYREVACDTLDWLLRDMQAPDGGFYGSVSADSDEGEGVYYKWTAAQLVEIAGEQDGAALAGVLNIGSTPAVPSLKLSPTAAGTDLLHGWLPALRRARGKRVQPTLDRKMVTAWNGAAISALVLAWHLSGKEEYLAAAEKAGDSILHLNDAHGRLLRATTDGQGTQPASTDDYGLLCTALFDLIQSRDVDASSLGNVLGLLADAETEQSGKSATGLEVPSAVEDGPEPSGPAALLHACLQAAWVSGDGAWRKRAVALAKDQAGQIEAARLDAAWSLHALSLLDRGGYTVVVAKSEQDSDQAFGPEYWQVAPPNAVYLSLAADSEQQPSYPALSDKVVMEGKATAYICNLASCLEPLQDPAQFGQELRKACGIVAP